MLSARTWIVYACSLSYVSFMACDASPAEPNKKDGEPSQAAKAEPPAPTKVEPPQPPKVEPPPAPAPAPAQPLSFTLGSRTFTAAVALSSRFNDQRRIIISSESMTCDELLAIPEQYKKGKVSFIVTTAWTVGAHPLASAEILEDDTHAVTNIYPSEATIEILAAPQAVGERGKIKLSATAAEGGAQGEIEVLLCE
jgi:hypothetical protein